MYNACVKFYEIFLLINGKILAKIYNPYNFYLLIVDIQ